MKRRLFIVVLIVAAALTASIVGYHASRNSTNQQSYFGDFDNPNRIEVTAWITGVDPTAQILSVMVTNVRPFGASADRYGNFAKDASLAVNSLGDWSFPIEAGSAASDDNLRLGILGPVTDYPFDRYKASFELHIVGPDGSELPTAITVLKKDGPGRAVPAGFSIYNRSPPHSTATVTHGT